MGMDSKLERLQAAPFFAGCGRKELERLGAIIDTVDVKAGYELFRQGSRSHYAYVVESGTAEVSIDGEVIAELGEGEMIGEVGLLVRRSASATVVARTPMTLLVIPHDQFEEVLKNTPDMGIAIARELARRLQSADANLHC